MTYRYTKEWRSTVVGCDFQDDPPDEDEDAKTRNVTDWPFHGDSYNNEQLNMGSFKVDRSQIALMNEFQGLDISDRVDALADQVQS